MRGRAGSPHDEASPVGACAPLYRVATVGVILVAVSALINFAWVTSFPIWSLTLLTIDFLVIYAIIAHDAEMKEARET